MQYIIARLETGALTAEESKYSQELSQALHTALNHAKLRNAASRILKGPPKSKPQNDTWSSFVGEEVGEEDDAASNAVTEGGDGSTQNHEPDATESAQAEAGLLKNVQLTSANLAQLHIGD
jgi:hypothetical protein